MLNFSKQLSISKQNFSKCSFCENKSKRNWILKNFVGGHIKIFKFFKKISNQPYYGTTSLAGSVSWLA